jgi:hypothetical protein
MCNYELRVGVAIKSNIQTKTPSAVTHAHDNIQRDWNNTGHMDEDRANLPVRILCLVQALTFGLRATQLFELYKWA